MYENLVVLGVFAFLYSIVCGRLDRTPVNGAVVFVAFGVLVSPVGLNLLHVEVDAEGLRLLAELTLALVLFTDAANADLGTLRRSSTIPLRLLLVGLPLTILLGFGVAVVLLGSLTLLEMAILATMLAPTDAALGKAVVTDPSVPPRFREGLNLESGLNDGLCVPIISILIALAAGAGMDGGNQMFAIKLVAEAIGIGAAVGVGVSVVGVWLLRLCDDRGWVTESWRQMPVITMALVCFAAAQQLGGSGFIACFLGGLLFGASARRHKHALLLAAENSGDVLALLTWVLFGAVVIPKAIGHFSWQVVLYSLLSLTVIRMLPVVLSLSRTGLNIREKLFMGWFGPRGLASIVFLVIVLGEEFPGAYTMAMTVICAILLSIVAHGLSARPLVAKLAKIEEAGEA